MNFENIVDKVSNIHPYLTFPIVGVWAACGAVTLSYSLAKSLFC